MESEFECDQLMVVIRATVIVIKVINASAGMTRSDFGNTIAVINRGAIATALGSPLLALLHGDLSASGQLPNP